MKLLMLDRNVFAWCDCLRDLVAMEAVGRGDFEKIFFCTKATFDDMLDIAKRQAAVSSTKEKS